MTGTTSAEIMLTTIRAVLSTAAGAAIGLSAVLAALTLIARTPVIRGPVRWFARNLRATFAAGIARDLDPWIDRRLRETLMTRNGGASVADVADAVAGLTRQLADHIDLEDARHRAVTAELAAITTRKDQP